MSPLPGMNPWDVVAWFLNVSSSVVIVFANKKLLDATSGHGFVFGELEPTVDIDEQLNE